MDEKWLEKAVEYKNSGHNCCQAVVHALADAQGVDATEYIKLAAGFGSGMGTMDGSCGALSGAVMMKGLETEGQKTTMHTREITAKFKELCGAISCRDIKGIDTGKVLCSCDDCVRNAIRAY